MTTLTMDRHKGRASSYDVAMAGLNYRIDEVRAAVGRVQLSKVIAGNLKRQALVEAYRQAFSGTKIICPFATSQHNSAYHLQLVILPENADREEVMAQMKAEGIQTSIHYPNFRSFSAYGELVPLDSTPVCDEITTRGLTLPLYPGLTIDEVREVSATLLRIA